MCPIKRVPQEGCISPCGRGWLGSRETSVTTVRFSSRPPYLILAEPQSLCRPLFFDRSARDFADCSTCQPLGPVALKCNSLPASRVHHATPHIRGDIPATFRAENAQTETGPARSDRAGRPARWESTYRC